MAIATPSHRSLRRRIVSWTGVALFLLLATLTWLGERLVAGRALRQADAGLLRAADQAALLIDHVVADRERQVRLLASLPSVVDAARAGGQLAERLGLTTQPLQQLEQRFDSTRTLEVDARTRRFLLDRAVSLDLAEVLVTEVHGFNAITTERTSDFVQSDEAWWRQAMSGGLSPAEASYDESARRVSISVASAVRESEGAPPVGVMKVVYGLTAVQQAVRQAATRGMIAVDVVDDSGRVLASSEEDPTLEPLPGREQLPRSATAAAVRYGNEGDRQRAALRPTNGGAWRVVAHLPEALPLADRRAVRLALGAGAAAVFLLILGALVGVNRFMTRHIADPAAALAITAEHVAAGNLSVQVETSGADDEIGRLGRATREMISGLRNLTLAIKHSAKETAEMAATLTASSEQMAASTESMAQTSAELSQQSAEMARTVQAMAGDSARMVELSAALMQGAAEGVKRNQQLRALAKENRERLDASARELAALVGEVQRSAAAAEALASASREIREFIALIQHLARQSKLLAYTAGVEARRAGPEGAGFVVVAKEVQRLADAAADATQKTDKVVTALLQRVEDSRASGERSARAVADVRDATQSGIASFRQVEAAIAGTEAWTNAIEEAAHQSRQVVDDTTRRLDALSRGVETFAAAMQEVAASAQQQSASTQEIVGTATELAASADRLSQQAGAFRLEEG